MDFAKTTRVIHTAALFLFILFTCWLLVRFAMYHWEFRVPLSQLCLILLPFLFPVFLRTSLRQQRWIMVFLASISVLVRLSWSFIVGTQPISDFMVFWEEARSVSLGLQSVFESKAPAAVLYYSLLYKIADDVRMVYIFNSLLMGLNVWLIYRITFLFTESEKSWIPAYFYAFYPASISFTSVVNSEMISVTFMLWAAYLFSSVMKAEKDHRTKFRKFSWIHLILCGICFGVAFLSRNVTILFLFTFLTVLFLFHPITIMKRFIISFVISVLFLASVSPQVMWNYEKHGIMSITSNPWGDLVLLIGTSPSTDGQYNKAEIIKLYKQAKQEGTPMDDQTIYKMAKKKALSRILGDPIGFLIFGATEKFDILWANDNTLRWSTAESKLFADSKHQRLHNWLQLGSNSYYFLLWLVALISAVLTFRSKNVWTLLISGCVLMTFFFHFFYEVQPRYHMLVMPFVCILASLAFFRLKGNESLHELETPNRKAS